MTIPVLTSAEVRENNALQAAFAGLRQYIDAIIVSPQSGPRSEQAQNDLRVIKSELIPLQSQLDRIAHLSVIDKARIENSGEVSVVRRTEFSYEALQPQIDELEHPDQAWEESEDESEVDFVDIADTLADIHAVIRTSKTKIESIAAALHDVRAAVDVIKVVTAKDQEMAASMADNIGDLAGAVTDACEATATLDSKLLKVNELL